MNITPEQARAELARRAAAKESSSSEITPEMARAELKRRQRELDEESLPAAALRHTARAAKDTVAGLASAGDIATLPIRLGLGIAKSKHNFRPVQQIVDEGVDKLTGGYTKPRTKNEARLSTAHQEVLSLPSSYGLGLAAQGAKALGPTAQKVGKWYAAVNQPSAANIGSTAGAALAGHEYANEVKDAGPLGTLAAGFAGGMGGNYGAAFLKNPKNAMRYGVGKLADFDPVAYQKQIDAGISPSLAASSKGALAQRAENTLYHYPFGHEVMKNFYQKRADEIKNKLGFEGHDFENIPDLSNKNLAREGAERLQKNKSDEYKALKTQFEPLIKRLKERSHLVDVSDLISDLKEKVVGLSKSSALETIPGQVLKRIQDKQAEVKKALIKQGVHKDMVDEALNNHIPYSEFDLLRDQMQTARKNHKSGTAEHTQVSDIYNYTSNKRHKTLEELGTPEEVAAFRKAQNLWSDYANTDIRELSGKEMGLKDPSYKITDAEHNAGAFAKLSSANPKYLQAVREGLPKEKHTDLAQSLVSEWGNSPTGFNLSNAHNKWEKLEKPVREEFLKLLPTAKSRQDFIQAMEFLGHNKKITQAVANTSQTAHQHQYTELIRDAYKNSKLIVGGALGASGTAAAAAVLSGVTGILGLAASMGVAKNSAKLMTDPVFLDRLNKTMHAKTPKAKANFFDLLMKTPSLKQVLKNSGYHAAKVEAGERTKPKE